MARSHTASLLVAVALVGLADLAVAQGPPDTVPPDAKRKVLDLKFIVQDVAGRVENLRMKETETEIRIEMAADVLFDFDKADVKPAAEPVLVQAAAVVRERSTGTVRIEGHTDAKGTDAYNQRLSERRANAVRSWFVAKGGLAAAEFAARGFGAKKPVAPNAKPDGSDDPDGRQKNRRVEIVILKKR